MSTKSNLIKFAPLLILIPLVLGDLGRIRLFGAQFINLADLIIGLIIPLGLHYYKPWRTPLLKSYIVWLTVLSATLFSSLLFRIADVPASELMLAALYPLRLTLYLALPLILIPHFTKHPSTILQISRYLIFSFITLSLAGFLQLIFLPNLNILELIGYDPHYFRLVSTWLDPNFFGAGLVFALLFTVSTHAVTNREKAIVLPLFTLALVLTFSRSAYIMAILAVVTYALLRRSGKTLIGLILATALTFLIYAVPRTQIDTSRNIDRSVSADLRLKSYGQALMLFHQHPLTGTGYNLTRYEKQSNNLILDMQLGGNSGAGIDSTWLLLLATTGIPGLLIFLAFWIRQAYFLIDHSQTNSKAKHFSTLSKFLIHASPQQHAAFALLLAWGIHAWFINSLVYVYLLIIWGIVFSLTLAQDRESK
jgi:O-antigen ligase